MYDAADANNPRYVPYHDCFSQTKYNVNYIGHGTGVVEIIAKCAVDGTMIHVANEGPDFFP